jgi:hypothetical protein
MLFRCRRSGFGRFAGLETGQPQSVDPAGAQKPVRQCLFEDDALKLKRPHYLRDAAGSSHCAASSKAQGWINGCVSHAFVP